MFRIEVVDAETGRGVPLVQLSTVHHVAYWTDSAGRVTIQEPSWMDREVFFHIASPGYDYPKDGFGFRGFRCVPRPGQSTRVNLSRTNIAERLYRITGEGIYRDTILAGLSSPVRQPLLNGGVVGQDTVIATPYRGRLYWFWGDTDRLGYPLGNFGASGATSLPPGRGGLDPSVGIDLDYFVGRDGFARPMCPRPDHDLRWIESVMTLRDSSGEERLFARVSHQKGLTPATAWYLMRFDDRAGHFEIVETWDSKEGHDSSHPFRARVKGVEYLYLYPDLRVPADEASLRDLRRYEAYTCLAGDGLWNGAGNTVERDASGAIRYRWQRGASRLHPGRMRSLLNAGAIASEDRWLALRDPDQGEVVEAGRFSVAWNSFRHRWVMVTSGRAGEIWFSEADTPTGPWVFARRVATHGDYNFYNPVHHPFFDQEGGRIIYFEGTYTASFSGAKAKTPRYEYNQMMYRLDLADARLDLPVPVYRVTAGTGRSGLRARERVAADSAWTRVEGIAFFALPTRSKAAESAANRRASSDRPYRVSATSAEVYLGASDGTGAETEQMVVATDPRSQGTETAVFRVITSPPDPSVQTGAGMVELCEYRSADGRRYYDVADAAVPPGFRRVDPALGWVWRNPQRVLTLDSDAVPVAPEPF